MNTHPKVIGMLFLAIVLTAFLPACSRSIDPATALPKSPEQSANPTPPFPVKDPKKFKIVETSLDPSPYRFQSGSPRYTSNFVYPEKGCGWMGIAGQVLDMGGKPLANLVIVVQGTLAGTSIDRLGLTSINTAYGPGGYEIELSSQVINSSGTLKIQVFNLEGQALTRAQPIATYADCQKNLIILNFQNYPGPYRSLLPWMQK